MTKTTTTAFNHYCADLVDLSSSNSDGARASRDYLMEQIVGFEENAEDFPALYGDGYYLPFGSFARKTKARPLDDVDIMPILHGCGGNAVSVSVYTYDIRIYNNHDPLWGYTYNGYVNSTKILNKFKLELMGVPNYNSTEINKRGESVVVDLASYDWSFDVVPAFAVSDGQSGISHFLIPDGKGQWKRTDPRIDQVRITTANQYHNGNLIPLIRVMKYWNENNRYVPKIGSYHLETMLIDGFWAQQPLNDIKTGIYTAFKILQTSILETCEDPKRLEPPLDAEMDWFQRLAFAGTAEKMANQLSLADINELIGLHQVAIETWQKVFPNFPGYGD